MKIAIVSIFREGYGGGCGRVAHDMAEQFSKEHDVILIRPADETRLQSISETYRILSIQSLGEGNAAVPVLSRKNINAMFDMLDAFKPDVVHAHEPISLGLLGQVWAAMHNMPFVYTTHVLPTHTLDFGASEFLKGLSGGLSASITHRIMADFYNHCDAVIALNDAAATDIRKFGYEGRLLAIPNARDMERLNRCTVANMAEPNKVLSFIGAIMPRKNQRYLVEVMQHLPENYILNIVGSAFTPDYEVEIKQLAQARGLDNVIFTGPVPYADVPDVLASTHVFVSASAMEVQSLSVIEALASGTPVVGLSNETVDELVDDSVGSWLAQDATPAEFAQRVQALCELPQADYEQHSAKARQKVAHLSWDRIREQTTTAYKELVDARAAAPVAQDRVAKVIANVRSEEVRGFLNDRLAHLKEFEARMYRFSKLNLISMANTKQISNTTWAYVSANRLVSSVVQGVTKIEAAFT